MKSLVLALDQGTSSSRAIVFDPAGEIRGFAQRELTQHYPSPGWVEHDPEEIWQTQLATGRQALAEAGAQADDIAAIGITNQRETTLLWERDTGRPVARAIVWQDRRTAEQCAELRQSGCEALFRDKTGLVLDPYFSGTKLTWMLDNIAGVRQRAEAGELAFGTVDSWLLWKLSGGEVHATDVSNASRTLMFDIHGLTWNGELLDRLRVPREVLPEARTNSEIYGMTDPNCFGGEIPVAGMAGDQQAALFGQACHRPGQAKNTYGTGCFLLMNTGTSPVDSPSGLLATIGWRLGEQTTYALEGSVFTAGAAVQWLRDQLGLFRSAAEIEELARQAPDNGGVYFVPAFSGLGAPHWDPHARGAITGLTGGTGKAHLARAVLEAIALQSGDILAAMETDSGITLSGLKVDGGASANRLLMQMQADLLRVPVVQSRIPETTALGAAYFAGLAVGVWSGLEEIAAQWRAAESFEPRRSPEHVREWVQGWDEAVRSVLTDEEPLIAK